MEEQIAKYLADEMGEAERKQFEEQLLSDEKLSEELQQSIASWEISGVYNQSNNSFDLDAAWNKVSEKTTIERSLKPEKTKYSFLKIAASIILIATAGFFLIKYSGGVQEENLQEHITSNAEVEEVSLPDGSVIKLNANSSLTYEEGFGTEHRNVVLHGAANFDVKRNESLPFIITTNNSQVEVLGTSFEVRAYKNESVEVNVSSGKVGFKSTKAKGEPAVLEAGEKAVLSEDGMKIQKGKVRNNNYSAWWTKELIFENAKLSEIAKDLAKAYWVEIEVSESIQDCSATQIIQAKDLDQADRKSVV